MLCQVFPESYQQQLNDKIERLGDLLPELPNFEVFESPQEHYRARAEFRIWHEEDDTFYIMFDQQNKQKVRIDECPMAVEAISDLMPKLMAAIKAQPVLRTKLFQIDFLATLSGEMLVTLIYRRPIDGDADWLQAAKGLKTQLPISHVIGRARKQKILLDQDYVT